MKRPLAAAAAAYEQREYHVERSDTRYEGLPGLVMVGSAVT